MKGDNGNVVTYNGEIYNYIELKNSLSGFWNFKTNSDTECILAAYTKYGENCLDHFRVCFLLLCGIQKPKANMWS